MNDLLTTLREAGVESVPNCPLCGSLGAHDERWDSLLSLCPPFCVNRCKSCSHRWLASRPNSHGVHLLYSREFYFEPEDLPAYATFAAQRADHFRSRAEKMVAHKQGLSILDFGAATGDFVEAARAVGAIACGVEVSPDAREIARRRGINLSAPDDSHVQSARFDAIHMNHVLEHMPEPIPHLQWCHEHLTLDGRLCIEVPHQFDNDSDRLRRIMRAGGRQTKFDAFSVHHTQFFTPRSLRKAVEMAGFRVERLSTPIAPSFGGISLKRRAVGMALALANRLHHGGDVIELWAVRQ